MQNGGVIGSVVTTNTVVASGIFDLQTTQRGLQNKTWPDFTVPVQYLIVAGGGSGGGAAVTSSGGGGGAGGLLTGTLYVNTGITYNVVVGAGGAQTSASQVDGNPGSNSSVFDLVAVGGGPGGTWQDGGTDGPTRLEGGSGGGGGGRNGTLGGNGTAGQGFAGGNTHNSTTGAADAGGGGGGAGGVGQRAPRGYVPGDGGPGLPSYITGDLRWFAGGGGAGTEDGTSYASGGIGGGGRGGSDTDINAGNSPIAPESGDVNTGGGGGGGSGTGGLAGRAGGSGIVILRSSIPAKSTTGSPTQNTVNGDSIYEFTGSGSITF